MQSRPAELTRGEHPQEPPAGAPAGLLAGRQYFRRTRIRGIDSLVTSGDVKLMKRIALVRVIAGEGSALANSRRRTDVTGADRYTRLARPEPAGPGRMGRAN